MLKAMPQVTPALLFSARDIAQTVIQQAPVCAGACC